MIKLLVSHPDLLEGLNTVATALPPRTSLPSLTNILLQTHEDRLDMAATDLDTTVTTSIPATITTPGSIALPGKKLHEIVKELPGGDVHMSGTGNRVGMNCEKSSFTLSGSPTDSFPTLPGKSDEQPVVLPIEVLADAINRTSYAVAKDDYRPALNGALWKMDQEGFEMVATDGHRLARIFLPGISHQSGVEAIIAPKALRLLARLAGEGEVEICFQGSQVSFDFGSTTIFSRTIEGPYPPYEKVIPSGNDKGLLIDRDNLVAALRRMRIIANPATHQVRLTLEKDNQSLEAEYAEAGEAHEKLEGEYDGEPLQIGFNGDFLREILRNMSGERVLLKMKNSSTAVVIEEEEPDASKEYIALLMPVKLPSTDEG
ncbi:DNA polymerase III subunit beta [Candidatus Fermentibacteria bacterium]|nr:DNA polymerase III subunit beta [Candidatus Fermentibacteria bacterium]